MKANELKLEDVMCGDWVDVRNDASPNIPHIEKITPSYLLRDEHWYGIELTPDILEKNGFTGGKYKNYCGNVFYLSVDGFREVGLTMSYKDNILWCERIEQNYPNSIGDKYAIHHLEYVHELQHALRLCGIEKEITV